MGSRESVKETKKKAMNEKRKVTQQEKIRDRARYKRNQKLISTDD